MIGGESLQRFEAYLERCVLSGESTSAVTPLLAYHFGYREHGPARRGKRLRPRLVLSVAQAEGADPMEAFAAAAAVEMVHNYSLIHDDIEDHDEFRHGRPTLWRRYGVAQAINAGDALCAIAFLTLTRNVRDAAAALALTDCLHAAHRSMAEGQALDLRFETVAFVTPQEYERMIEGKTAALFGAACAMGALCAGAPPQRVEAYRRAGIAFGTAFQMYDDLLGIWAAGDRTGKTPGHDLARRKWSFPVVWALAQEASPARTVVAEAYAAGRPLDPEAVRRVTDALEEMGADRAAHAEIERRIHAVGDEIAPAIRDALTEVLTAAVR